MEWWINLLKVLGKTFFMILFCVFMRIRIWFDPSVREEGVKKMKKKIHLTDGDSKYDASFDPSNAENFLFTWKMISANFNAEMQNINKVGDLIKPFLTVNTCMLLQTARLYGAAPDPELHDPIAGDTKRLLSVASPSGSTLTQTRTLLGLSND